MKKGTNNSLNTKTIKDDYRRSQDNLTSGQFAPDNFVSHFKLDNFASKKIALFLFATRHVYKRPGKCHSLVLREILLYNMKIFKGNIGGKGGARCPRWDFPLHLFSLVASSGRWHPHAENNHYLAGQQRRNTKLPNTQFTV